MTPNKPSSEASSMFPLEPRKRRPSLSRAVGSPSDAPPTHAEIAELAYRLWMERGAPMGSAEIDWESCGANAPRHPTHAAEWFGTKAGGPSVSVRPQLVEGVMSSTPLSEARTLSEGGSSRAPASGGASLRRRLPIGAECQPEGGVHFRVWAPQRKQVRVALNIDGTSRELELTAEGNGYYSGLAEAAGAGTLYRFQLDADEALYPDPASRFQPEGPSGPSRVVDPAAFAWSEAGWPGAAIRGQVIYEMHIGTL